MNRYNDRNFGKTRSSIYQALILESPTEPESLGEVAEAQGLIGKFGTTQSNEMLMDLKDELRIEFWRVVDTQLTDRQRDVLHLIAEGKTQVEVAKALGVNQSSITKSINGNLNTYNKTLSNKIIHYGGSARRLRKLITSDLEIQKILKSIAELHDEEW